MLSFRIFESDMARGRILVLQNKESGECYYYSSIKIMYRYHSFGIKENMMSNYLRADGYNDERYRIVRVPLINE